MKLAELWGSRHLHLLLTQYRSGQRPVCIVAVKGFMILQHIGTDQGLVGGGVYIGDAVLCVIGVAVIVLIRFSGLVVHLVHLVADEIILVGHHLEAVVPVGSHHALATSV
jgi:hypothetical protein